MVHFWEQKSLFEMSNDEWELLCDGCGLCCFHKVIDGYGVNEHLYYTRIACDQLDLCSGKCSQYESRFLFEPDCTKLTKDNLTQFTWLPKSCAYRLLYENKPLFEWHPLISGTSESVKQSGVMIQDGIHAKHVKDWTDYVIFVEKM